MGQTPFRDHVRECHDRPSRFGGKRGYADMRVRGYAGMRVCGYADMRVCGYADMRIFGYADMRVCGYAGTSNWFNNSKKNQL